MTNEQANEFMQHGTGASEVEANLASENLANENQNHIEAGSEARTLDNIKNKKPSSESSPGKQARDKQQSDKNASNKKVLAHAGHPIIDAVIKMRYAFSNYDDALNKITYLENRFVKSSLADLETPATTVLWIRGYDVTKKEEEAGYTGNYALISPDMTPDKKYTLIARKLEVEIGKHPQRKRKKSKHPDWGFWVLRRVQKGWRYDSVEEAYADLMAIAEEFPEVSIPSSNKLFTIIYRKATDDSLPLFRVVLEVEALQEGGFTITCTENTYRSNKTKEVPTEDAPEPIGKFASMIALKKNRKKNINDVLKEQKDANNKIDDLTQDETE